ncbi:MAG: hypothetical protein ACR2IF_16795 [Terriglobales bacterium]
MLWAAILAIAVGYVLVLSLLLLFIASAGRAGHRWDRAAEHWIESRHQDWRHHRAA